MKLLLDTQVFIWWDSEPARLSAQALALCQEPTHTLLFSVASAWEMQIKLQLGKLALKLPLATLIEGQRQANRIEILPVALPHVLALQNLPTPHKDPFDRLLITQANIEGATLISSDPIFREYPVAVLW
jgi:PIN domain nuclease of toxin-antitoxin system